MFQNFSEEEINSHLSSLSIPELKELVSKKKKELEIIGLDLEYSISFTEDEDFLFEKIELLEDKEKELEESFLNNPNRYFKFQTHSKEEFGILAVNPFYEIDLDTLNDSNLHFYNNIYIISTASFQELIERNFKLKTYSNKKATENIDNILSSAIDKGATDIYIRANETIGIVQFRIDEKVINQNETLSRKVAESIRASLAENSGQDSKKTTEIKGQFIRNLKGRKREFRLSILNDVSGFQINIRILATVDKSLTVDKLGYLPEHIPYLRSFFKRKQGLILLSGATGSGKTTTLAVLLRDIQEETNSKVITMEDPVEIKNPNFIQVSMSSEAAEEQYQVTYANTTKICLRQKPDILLIGEIRDQETAKATVNASLSGHLTVSTVHSSTAKLTISRLKEVGLADHNINDTLRGVVAQRLNKKLCSCKVLDKQAIAEYCQETGLSEDEIKIYKASEKGCSICRKRNLGYNGKTVIYEIAEFKNNYQGNYKNFPDSYNFFVSLLEVANRKLISGEIDYESYLTIKKETV